MLLPLAGCLAAALPAAAQPLVPAGSINDALRHDKIVFVIEDHPAIRRYAAGIRDRFFASAEILTAAAASERDLSDHNLLVYGTPDHPFLAPLGDRLPARFGDGNLRLDRVYVGLHLRLIGALRHPQTAARRMVLYLGAALDDVVGINEVVHGPTEWVVADGDRLLGSGAWDCELPVALMQADLDFLAAKLTSVHPATVDGPSAELAAALAAARAAVPHPLRRRDFWFVLNRVVMTLHDAHTALDPALSGERLDLPLRWLNDGLIVAADTDDLRKGDRIVAFAGHSEAELRMLLADLVPADNVYWLQHVGESLLRDAGLLDSLGIEAAPLQLEVERGGRVWAAFVGAAAGGGRGPQPPDWVRWEIDAEAGLGVLTLDRCRVGDAYAAALRGFFAAVRAAGIDRVAVDLRRNSGGDSRVVDEFLRFIDVDSYLSYSGEVRVSADSRAQRGGDEPLGYRRYGPNRRHNHRHPAPPAFAGELFVLTSGQTFSSGTWFAAVIQDNGIGKVVGEPTGNAPSAYGDILRFTLPGSGFALSVSFKKWLRPRPDRDPQDAVHPDHPVAVTRADLLEDRDPVLAWLRARSR